MQVLIQQLEGGLFLGADGAWIKDQGEARVFENSAEAIVHCVVKGLREVRVAMLFGDPEMDLYYYPFKDQRILEETKKLKADAQTLKTQREALVQDIRASMASIADQAKQLPLNRKKKRQRRPEA